MKPRNVHYTSDFLRGWRKTPEVIKNKARKKEDVFRKSIYHPSLRTHKLKGELKEYYSFYVDYHWRIVFHIDGKDVYFDAIGTHSVYK